MFQRRHLIRIVLLQLFPFYVFNTYWQIDLEVTVLSRIKIIVPILLVAFVAAVFLYHQASSRIVQAVESVIPTSAKLESVVLISNPRTTADKIVNGAKTEAINQVKYNADYVSIPYPNGDVPAAQGACTEVVIRAFRKAGFDLQKLVHEDMKRHFSAYPMRWGLRKPDSNIDHRRVRNLMVFFNRHGTKLTVQTEGEYAKTWKPGDIVCWDLNGNGLTHTGIVSNIKGSDNLPMIIHNIGPVATEQEGLTNWKIIGHYRYPKR